MESIGAIARKDNKLKELEEKRLNYLMKKEALEEECQGVEQAIETNSTKLNEIQSTLASLFTEKANANREIKVLAIILAFSGVISLATASLFWVGIGLAFSLFKIIKPIGDLKRCANSQEDILKNKNEINKELSALTSQKEAFVSQINLVLLAIQDLDVEREVIESIRETLLKYVDADSLGSENLIEPVSEQSLIRVNPNLMPKD